MDRLNKIIKKTPISSTAGGNRDRGDTHTSQGYYDRVTSRWIENTKSNAKISIKIDAGKNTQRMECTPPDPNVVLSNLVFLLQDEVGQSQKARIQGLLEVYVRATAAGFCIRDLSAIVFILDYLIAHQTDYPSMLTALLENAYWPVILMTNSDVDKYCDHLSEYFNFLGYTLMRLEDDSNFELAHSAVFNQLQGEGSANSCVMPLRVRRAAAARTTLVTTAVRMLPLCSRERFQKYIELALLLTCISPEICIAMIKDKILENILYRFNPYFPDQKLPEYEINPKSPHDDNVKFGDGSIHLAPVLSLLMILLHHLKQYLEADPSLKKDLHCPDSFSLRCWIWAFRLECRARDRRHERSTMLIVTMAMTQCFGDQLRLLSAHLMPDILSLAVQTEIPTSSGWLAGVSFNTTKSDVQFKKLLIYCTVLLLKTFPHNIYLVESQHWMVGLMYIVDPCLYRLRCRWSQPLFAELRHAALQALVIVVPLCPPHLVEECGLIRRTLWYIEWFTVSPFEMSLLYWNLRLMHTAVGTQDTSMHRAALRDMADSHAVIVIIRLCYTLLNQAEPPVERKQAVLALCLQLLTNSANIQREVTCAVYPHIQWPDTVNYIAKAMLNITLRALTRSLIISSRWTISLFNFIWESIMWNKAYRSSFISENGVYKILDVISMSGEWLQCIGLALVCEASRAGEAVGQLVTWRARPAAVVVSRGASLPTLLAAIARDECRSLGVQLHKDTGVIESMDYPLLGDKERAQLEILRNSEPSASATPRDLMTIAAAGLFGSRLSKVYALLQMLSDDLHNKEAIADETYKIYKNVSITVEDEVMLTLCAHCQVCKMGHVWSEVDAMVSAGGVPLLPEDQQLLDEFLLLYKGWAKEIKYQQEHILERQSNMDRKVEGSLYALLARCRLTTALDALKELHRCARSDLKFRAHESLREAVSAHHRRCETTLTDSQLIRTFQPPVDDTNVIGQHVKVFSIPQENEQQLANMNSTCYSCRC